ncbi:MAG: sporulation initiation factor Spo0A C-terminal domain-containing protein [Dorea sp.]
METQHIEKLIRSLGIGATYRGFRYLNYGILLCLEDENYLLSISKLLYPEIAKAYHTTSSSVERDIRTIIKICWERGNRTLLQDIAMHPLSSKPTSGEFLDILVAHLSRNPDKKSLL